ncbi:hypothetical protein NECAME_04644 [Necator americanus]|uniref:Protein kinase domain-containing protein n=1 Tax=Necator americanus TaxID=51031 RepID=W2SSD2_NECAM|nr:hypothetical protein NECAME_04644 [Necator americanus]ETN71612.1 hypothetical protein NECAME_04644 [Necator americanus]
MSARRQTRDGLPNHDGVSQENRERNFEMIFLTGIGRKKHKNIVQMSFAFSNKGGKNQKYQIVHRDIKPLNLLLDHANGLLKIGDFGSAKVVAKVTKSTAYQVTRFYRPPELLLGSEYYNWTVGTLLAHRPLHVNAA